MQKYTTNKKQCNVENSQDNTALCRDYVFNTTEL